MTAQQQATVTIQPLIGAPDALLHIYPNQTKPQDCYIALRLTTGEMWTDWNAETGNTVPSDVWHGLTRRYQIPVLQPATVNELMQKIAPFAQRVLDGSEIVWDGSNHVARLTEDAREAENDIDTVIEAETDYDGQQGDVYWWDVADWLDPEIGAIKARLAAGESIDALEADYGGGDGSSEDRPVVDGVRDYLEMLQTEVRNDD